MEKAKTELAKQEEDVKLAESRFKFSETEAVRLRAEATRIEQEAGAALEIEKIKLLKCQKNVLAAELALSFAPDTKIVFANSELEINASYSTYTADGKPIRFAIKSVAYPLELENGALVGLDRPTMGKRVNLAKVTYTRRGYSHRFSDSTILETDVHDLLVHREIDRMNAGLKPEIEFPIGPACEPHYKCIRMVGHDAYLIVEGTKGANSWYEKINYPPVITGGYIVFCVAVRTSKPIAN